MTDHTPRLLALVLAALALAACSASSVGEVQDEGSAGTASPITLPGTPPESAPTVTGATVEAPQPAADTGSLYLVRFGQLEAVPRVIDGAPRPRVALQELLAGPTAAERSLGYRTAIPDGTELVSFAVDGSTATVDLSAEFAASQGALGFDEEQVLALAQVVYTVTDAEGIDAVRLLVDGQPAGSVLGGALADRPMTREFIGLLLARTLDRAPRTVCQPSADTDEGEPQEVPVVLGRLRLRGDRLVLRGRLGPDVRTFVTRVLHDGNELQHEVTTSCVGAFRQELPVPAGVSGEVVVQVYVPTADGGRSGLVERRIDLPTDEEADAAAADAATTAEG